jgi:hypothetical protein
MNIELKNVKHSEFASHETNCFEATIYIDGKKAGEAHNNGCGGSTSIFPNTLYEKLQAYALTLPPIQYDEGKHVFLQSADGVIDDLVTAWLYARDLKKAMQKRILFVRGQDMLETKGMDSSSLQKWLSRPDLQQKLNADKVLNLLPFVEAVSVYREMQHV